jgi:uncharacterized membrane protein
MGTPTYIAVALVLLSSTDGSAQNRPRIETEIIGSFQNSQWTVPMGINNRGDIVGYVAPTGTMAGFNAFMWTRDAGFQLIATDAVATDINNRGDVTGYTYECVSTPTGGSCAPHGFVWNPRTGFTQLGDLVPAAINNRGDVAGDCSTGETLAACAILNGERVQWTCEEPSCGQVASGINERGDVVGWRFSPDFEEAMFFPRGGSPIVLGAQTAEDINNAGTIAGRAPTAVWPSNATLWTRAGLIQAPSPETTVAVAVNARGWAAGIQFGSGAPNQAFFWDGSGPTLTLLAPGSPGSEATDINDRGEVVGYVWKDFSYQLVIWTVRR